MRQQNNVSLGSRIDPHRCSGPSRMPIPAHRQQIPPVRRQRRINVPPKPPQHRSRRRLLRPRHFLHRKRRQNPVASIQQSLRKLRQIIPGRKQPSLPRHAAHPPRRRIMHHSPKHVLILVILRRSNLFYPPSPRRRRRHKPRPHHLQRQKNMPLRIRIQRLPGNPFHQRTQNNKINVAINKSRTRRLLRSLRKRHPVSRLLTLPRSLQIQIRLQPRVVRQQLPHRDVVLPILRKLRQILRHRIIQPHLTPLHQLHHRRSSSNHLGQRSQIKHRIQSHRLAPRLQSPRPISLPVDHLPIMPNNQHRPRNLLLVDSLLNDSINPR